MDSTNKAEAIKVQNKHISRIFHVSTQYAIARAIEGLSSLLSTWAGCVWGTLWQWPTGSIQPCPLLLVLLDDVEQCNVYIRIKTKISTALHPMLGG